jgi:hypothetical protein
MEALAKRSIGRGLLIAEILLAVACTSPEAT